MGKGPNLRQVIKDKNLNEAAIDADVAARVALMHNSEKEGLDYINSHTDGVIIAADSGKPEFAFTNNKYHCKYSDEYSLGALDKIIDGVIDTAKAGFKVYASEGADPEAAMNLVSDVGGLIKAGLALASSSSTTTEELSITFSQFMVGDKTFAVYNAINSYNMGAENAWGNKELIVIAQTTLMVYVKTDPNIQLQEMLHSDLQHLIHLKKEYDQYSDIEERPKRSDYATHAEYQEALGDFNDTLQYIIDQINKARQDIVTDRQALAGNETLVAI